MNVDRQLKVYVLSQLQEVSFEHAILELSPSAQSGDLDVAIAVPAHEGFIELSAVLRQKEIFLADVKPYDSGAMQATYLDPKGGEVRVDLLFDPHGSQKYAISTKRFIEASTETERRDLLTGYMLSKAHFKGRYRRFLALLRRPEAHSALQYVQLSRFFCFPSKNFFVFSVFSSVRRLKFRIRSIPRYLEGTFRPNLRFSVGRLSVETSVEERHQSLIYLLEGFS